MSAIDTITASDTADAAANVVSLPTLPEPAALAVRNVFGVKDGDSLRTLLVSDESAGRLSAQAPTIRRSGARSKKADTSADFLFSDMLAVEGGALRLLPVTVNTTDNGKTRDNASTIARKLDDAYLRLSEQDRARIIYGQASDRVETVNVYGIEVQAKVPGLFYVMALGGAVKSHPVMGAYYRAIAAAARPTTK